MMPDRAPAKAVVAVAMLLPNRLSLARPLNPGLNPPHAAFSSSSCLLFSVRLTLATESSELEFCMSQFHPNDEEKAL